MLQLDSLPIWKRVNDLSLKVKLLGIYLLGLALLGVVGYGFFISQELKSYERDYQVMTTEADYFEKQAFAHLQYTNNLFRRLKTIYNSAGCSKRRSCDKSKVVNAFLKSISVLGNKDFNFAIFAAPDKLIACNDEPLQQVVKKPGAHLKIIRQIIVETQGNGCGSARVSFLDAGGKSHEYFINALFFEPLNYVILALADHQALEKRITAGMLNKRQKIFNAITFSLLLGCFCTLLVCGLLFLYLRNLSGKILEITRSIDRLATSERSETRLAARSQDEIGRLITAFNVYVRHKVDLERFKKLIEEDESISDVYNRIFVILREFGISDFALYEVKNSKNHLNYIQPETSEEGTLEVGNGPMPCSPEILMNADFCRAKRLAHEIRSDDGVQVCPRFRHYQEGWGHVCIPIIISGTVGEVVQITIRPEDHSRISSQVPVIMEYFRNAAPVIESKRLLANLKEATLKDSLTGLYNRRFLEGYVDILSSEIEREKKNAAVLMADLDYFKKVNDVYGHQVGDRVLQTLARILRNTVRRSDVVIRYGGEEFLLILKHVATADEAVDVAEKIRKSVEEHVMKLDGAVVLKKTVTIGLALFPEDSDTFWHTVKFADVALYHGKSNGRNQVVRFLPAMWKDDEDY
jgi:diguanylate cyclase (GGDEF)-like protein